MRKSILIAVALLVICASAYAKVADATGADRRVILIVADNISVADLEQSDMPALKAALSDRAAVGLMNARPAKGALNKASGYLSIGMGARGDAGSFGNLAANKHERLLMGGVPQPPISGKNGMVVSPGLPEMTRLSGDLGYPATPGALGATLKQAGIKRAVYGNADAMGSYHREINLIAMDDEGTTDFGDVRTAVSTPGQAIRAVDSGVQKARFVAVEFAPTSRIGSRRNFLSDAAVSAQKHAQLRQLDKLVGILMSRRYLNGRTMIILATPSPSPEMVKAGDYQTPLMVAGPGYKGILTSPSTRWKGLVTNQDVAPTIAQFLGMPALPGSAGRPLGSEPTTRPLSTITRIDHKAFVNYSARFVLLTGFVSLAVVTIAALGIALLVLPESPGLVYSRGLLLGLMYTPLAALLANSFDPPGKWVPLALVPLSSLAMGYATWLLLRRRPLMAIVTPCALLVITIVGQLSFGSLLERNSVMGMSSIMGARFYGVGNEYMGILLAAYVICLAVWLESRGTGSSDRAPLIAASSLVLVAILGLPAWGANVGGALAGAVTGILAFHLLRGKTLGVRHLAYVLLGLAAAVVVVLTADLFGPETSHAGRAAQAVGAGGAAAALLIITRKLSTNFLLIAHSSWTNILTAAFAVVVALRLGAAQAVARVTEEHKVMTAGFKTIALGSIAALLLNDSGVVAAALMVLYATCAWLYFLIQAE